MAQILIKETVDINDPPFSDNLVNEKGHIIIGDMHANALKFLYFLKRHGVLTLSDAEYIELGKLVHGYLTEEDIRRFNEILNAALVNNNASLIFIGDLLADRMTNDYFILKILAKLHHHKVPLEIILSNHDVEFILGYESSPPDFKPKMLLYSHAASMNAVKELIDRGLVKSEEVVSLIDSAYKPNLRALSYTLDEANNEITIYSHAGIGLDNIQNIAALFGVPYQDETIFELAQTIENINARFSARYVNKNKVHTLLDTHELGRAYAGADIDPKKHPLVHSTWNRVYAGLNRPLKHKGYRIVFVHGHDSNESTLENIYNLDNVLGKGINYNEAPYTVLVTQEKKLRPELLQTGIDVSEDPPTPILSEFESSPIEEKELQKEPSRVPVHTLDPAVFAQLKILEAQQVSSYTENRISLRETIRTINDYLREKVVKHVSNTVKAPSKHPIISGLLMAAIASATLSILGQALIYGALAGLAVYSTLSIRNIFYKHKDQEVVKEREKKGSLSTSSEKIYRQGIEAAYAFEPYIKSFADIQAWKNFALFGAGLHHGLKKQEENERPQNRLGITF